MHLRVVRTGRAKQGGLLPAERSRRAHKALKEVLKVLAMDLHFRDLIFLI